MAVWVARTLQPGRLVPSIAAGVGRGGAEVDAILVVNLDRYWWIEAWPRMQARNVWTSAWVGATNLQATPAAALAGTLAASVGFTPRHSEEGNHPSVG
jgi:hypothetical protein